MIKPFLCSLAFVLALVPKASNDSCNFETPAFKSGELTRFKVFYTLGVYIAAGEVSFRVNLESVNNKPVYHVLAEGKTYDFYDRFFKVRDRYESFMDTNTLQTMKFVRQVNEGSFKKFENVTFNQQTNTAITNEGVFKVPGCVKDVVSAIFQVRSIDFSQYKPGDTIPFDMFIDNEVYHLSVRYSGKDIVRTKYGRFRAIKCSPQVIKGSVFQGNEQMIVWVSDDKNHLPLRIESPISVGSVKVDMMAYQNLRYPLDALLSPR